MPGRTRMHHAVRGLILMILLVSGISSRAVGDDPDSVRELKARIEAVERQNQALLQALQKKRILDNSSIDGGDIPRLANDDAGADDQLPPSPVSFMADRTELPGGASEPEWYEVGSDVKMFASWRNGLEIESKNHDFRVHIGGRTQLDFAWFNADDDVQASLPLTNKFRDGVNFRRARFRIDGVMYETMEWAAEFDFVNSAGAGVPGTFVSVVAPTDLWWQWNDVPVLQHFRVGNQKEPIGFEHLTSSRYLNFMERSFMQDAFFGGFNNGFTPGAQFFGTMADERMTYALGVFDPTTNVFATNTGPAEYSFSGRLTALPYYRDEGRSMIHLGVSARYWSLDEHQARFRTRASVRSGPPTQWPVIADTGLITGVSDEQINVELLGQFGPFLVIAEFLTSWLQDAQNAAKADVGTVVYRGAYVETLYFLTGEHRNYNRKTGVIDRVTPTENAFFARGQGEDGSPAYGWGAWQLAARYQFIDLDNKGIKGGILHDTTLGVNWYLNPNFKVQANWFFLYRENVPKPGTGSVQGLGIRLAHDF